MPPPPGIAFGIVAVIVYKHNYPTTKLSPVTDIVVIAYSTNT